MLFIVSNEAEIFENLADKKEKTALEKYKNAKKNIGREGNGMDREEYKSVMEKFGEEE